MVIGRIEFDMRNLSLTRLLFLFLGGRAVLGIRPMALQVLKLLSMSRALYLEVILLEKLPFLLQPKRW